jgi:hypothetical protein
MEVYRNVSVYRLWAFISFGWLDQSKQNPWEGQKKKIGWLEEFKYKFLVNTLQKVLKYRRSLTYFFEHVLWNNIKRKSFGSIVNHLRSISHTQNYRTIVMGSVFSVLVTVDDRLPVGGVFPRTVWWFLSDSVGYSGACGFWCWESINIIEYQSRVRGNI